MKIAVAGAGRIGRLRARSVMAEPTTSLVAVADTDETAARRAAGKSGARIESDFGRLTADPGIDTIMIATPVGLHEEMVLSALEAGKHVLVEKPLSNSVASCRRIHDAAKSSGRTVGVGFNHRYYRAMKYLKGVVDAGTLGTLDNVRIRAGHCEVNTFPSEWMYKGELSGGGAMMDIGLHATDLARYVLGEITEVYGLAAGNVWKIPGSEDRAVAVFKGASGASALYEATWNEWQGYQIALEAYGDKGMVRGTVAPQSNLLITHERPGAAKSRSGRTYLDIKVREKVQGWETTTLASFQDELSDFLRRVAGGTVPLGTTLDGLRAVQIAHAVYESTRTGQAVSIS
jgi:predicted dehydrogenase